MAGFNQWFMGMLESGWNGLVNATTDVLDKFGIGTQRRQQEFNAAEAEKEREFNAAEAQKTRDENRYLAEHQYQIAKDSIEEAGLNPNMIYGAGGTPSLASTSSSASAGSGARSAIQSNSNILGQISGLMNSVTNARALDYQMNRKSENQTTQSIYNSVGRLLKVIVTKSIK